MSTEWTTATLKVHYDAILEARDKSLDRALMANEKRLDGMNEMKAMLSDAQSKFLPRREALAMLMFILALIGLVFSVTLKR